MKVVCIIQSRLSSERLPSKALLQCPPESGVSMLEMVVRKCLLAQTVDEVVVVTPDKMLVKICEMLHVKCRVKTWPERDVVKEFYEAAKRAFSHSGFYENPDVIVRVTADCPLLRPEAIDEVVTDFLKCGTEMSYNTDESTGQLNGEGSDVEAFSYDALEHAYRNAKGDEREHVTLWIRRYCKTRFVPCAPIGIRSINTLDDYLWLCKYLKEE